MGGCALGEGAVLCHGWQPYIPKVHQIDMIINQCMMWFHLSGSASCCPPKIALFAIVNSVGLYAGFNYHRTMHTCHETVADLTHFPARGFSFGKVVGVVIFPHHTPVSSGVV